jgi:hypothetical protein
MSPDGATRLVQQRQARTVGSLQAQLDTGGGSVVDGLQIIRVNLAVPSILSISVEEDFLVVPTLPAGLIILGMTFLESNCILDLPDVSITYGGSWERKHRISLDGSMVRCLTLVSEHDFIIPSSVILTMKKLTLSLCAR